MKTNIKLGTVARVALPMGVVVMLGAPAHADNPIVQTNYTADPAPMVFDGKLYLYTSHDEDVTVNDFYTMNDWRLYSTEDMVNWTDHGSPAGLHTFSWGTDSAWAPQGIERNGSFYLYVPLNNNTGARIGVAVSDNAAGPFMDPLGRDLAQSDASDIDPTVFIDDDGQAHMYWGNATLKYVKLNEDMISYAGTPTTVALSEFTEGPWFYKRESLYYMVYAAMGGNTEKISYATSDAPTGPWTTRGDVMAAGPTYTNHAGIIDYKGHSYFFYHNSALPGGNDFKRSVCVEEFTYGNDGSIPELVMSEDGPEPVATLNPFDQVEAETIAFSTGLKTEESDDAGGGLNVTQISGGDYIKVRNVDFQAGVTSFEARVSSAVGDANIELHLDSQTGMLLGTCDVSGASAWTTTTCPVSGGSGTHDLFLVFTGNGNDLFKFNWWKFTGTNVPPDGGTDGTGSMVTESGSSSDTDSVGGTSASDSTNTIASTVASDSTNTTASSGTTASSSTAASTSSSNTTTTASSTSTTSTSAAAITSSTAGMSGGDSSGPSGAGSSSDDAVSGSSGSESGACSCRVGARYPSGTPMALGLAACAMVLVRRRNKHADASTRGRERFLTRRARP